MKPASTLQVLSHSIPGLQGVDAAPACRWRAASTIASPRRCTPIPTVSPLCRAADGRSQGRRRRTRTHGDELGFKGAMVNGLTGGLFHDDERFWPIYERAEALDVPIYIHPHCRSRR